THEEPGRPVFSERHRWRAVTRPHQVVSLHIAQVVIAVFQVAQRILGQAVVVAAQVVRYLAATELLSKGRETLVQPGLFGRPTPNQHMLIVVDHVLELMDEYPGNEFYGVGRRNSAGRIGCQSIEDLGTIRPDDAR